MSPRLEPEMKLLSFAVCGRSFQSMLQVQRMIGLILLLQLLLTAPAESAHHARRDQSNATCADLISDGEKASPRFPIEKYKWVIEADSSGKRLRIDVTNDPIDGY